MAIASENGKVKGGGGGGGGGAAGGRIRIGATGKVSALMMQEIDSNRKTISKKPVIRIQTAPVSISCGAASTKRLRRMTAVDGGSSSNGRQIKAGKKKTTHQIPMLHSEDLWMDKTPIRGKERKKVTQRIVETVDLKCGKNDGDWSMNPITNQLRRLSFSKISD
ncbi:hypothetical protein L2E82_02288 [Cichorium intybus]|uniref:Uncharacterized protein n=1 Tax=Cichorium intybus TaxID=13427 RepID=A0ACB9H2J1_CICIN|nr:hypothetical protein L2E82_02288 [Cichorium intybus]